MSIEEKYAPIAARIARWTGHAQAGGENVALRLDALVWLAAFQEVNVRTRWEARAPWKI
jgi:hypothetical protein